MASSSDSGRAPRPGQVMVQQLRPVRSYVLREGRITRAQQRAFGSPWQRFGLSCPDEKRLDPAALFGNRRPLYLEIGFGNGEALLEMARRHPERNYLGIEVHRPGIGQLLLNLEREGLENVRIIRRDAVEVLDHCLPPACLAGVFLFFPDPWPKRRHHKRRIVNAGFLASLARVIQPGGSFHLATDWQDYAEQMMQLLSASPDFRNATGPGRFVPRPPDRPLTRFEQRGRRLGHLVWDLLFYCNGGEG